MRCEELAEYLTDLMEGTLDTEVEEAALEHLASCTDCDRVLSETRSAVDLIAEHGRAMLDDGSRERLKHRIVNAVRSSAVD